MLPSCGAIWQASGVGLKLPTFTHRAENQVAQQQRLDALRAQDVDSLSMALGVRVRSADGRDDEHLDALLASDPIMNVFAAARINEHRRTGAGQVWLHDQDGALVSACYAGANLVPVSADACAVEAFAAQARKSGRHCSSIVGPREAVLALWNFLAPVWSPSREVRAHQPVLATDRSPSVSPDPRLRLAQSSDFDALWPAAVAMYTEEVGVSPLLGDGGMSFRRRLTGMVAAGRVYLIEVAGEVIFKAEVGSVALGACQVQGVWTAPQWRGAGIGTAAMAAVTVQALAQIAPLVTLYVNDFNHAARAIYAKCGYTHSGDFATILF